MNKICQKELIIKLLESSTTRSSNNSVAQILANVAKGDVTKMEKNLEAVMEFMRSKEFYNFPVVFRVISAMLFHIKADSKAITCLIKAIKK